MPERLWVKICGVTRPNDLALAHEAGADAVGLNFFPASPRYVGNRAAELLRDRPPGLQIVGVFVNEPAEHVEAIASELGLDQVQWVGDHRPERICRSVRYVLCWRVASPGDLAAARAAVSDLRPTALLVDAKHGTEYGGTGRTAPWELLTDFDAGVPLILAGGLTPDTVAAAVARVRPAGVDVAGGVETAPGVKDAVLVRRFITQARQAFCGHTGGGAIC